MSPDCLKKNIYILKKHSEGKTKTVEKKLKEKNNNYFFTPLFIGIVNCDPNKKIII